MILIINVELLENFGIPIKIWLGGCCSWWNWEKDNPKDFSGLPDCPCKEVKAKEMEGWSHDPGWVPRIFHHGAANCYRGPRTRGHPNQQCCYDKKGKLITGGTGAGTPDSDGFRLYHWLLDVVPMFFTCRFEGRWACYIDVRPPNDGGKNNCDPNEKGDPIKECDCVRKM